jgi:methionyl-tRNA formyltransferase
VTDGRVRTVFLGSGGFGRDSLRRLGRHPAVDLVGVVTAPVRPAGRRGTPTPSAIQPVAEELGLAAILTPERLRAPESIAAVLALDPALLVLADYGQIVPAALLDLPFGALNLHPSLLPRHRGATPIPAVILAGDRETGVSLMQMDAGLDTGPIVAIARLALDGTETAPELEERLAAMAADLLERSLGPWVGGELTLAPQDDDGSTLTRPLRREDGRLDPGRPAATLERQVRAYQPWPGSFIETAMGRLVVWSATVARGRDVVAGTIGEGGLATAAGTLVLDEVQPAGGRRMAWTEFVRGRPRIVGTSVVAGP